VKSVAVPEGRPNRDCVSEGDSIGAHDGGVVFVQEMFGMVNAASHPERSERLVLIGRIHGAGISKAQPGLGYG